MCRIRMILVTKALGQFIQENQGFEIKPMSYYLARNRLVVKIRDGQLWQNKLVISHPISPTRVYRLA